MNTKKTRPRAPVKPRGSLFVRFLTNPWGRAVLLVVTLWVIVGAGTFTYFYVKYARITDEKLKAGPFTNMSLLYAAPRPVLLGEEARGEEIAAYLRRCGYTESNSSRAGWYRVRPDAVEINPGPDAYDQEGAVIKIEGGKVSNIISLRDHTDRTEYLLEPELMTNLFDQQRKKRRFVHFNDIPKVMVNAVLSAEDKHFFEHAGFDPIRIMRAAIVDIAYGKRQGASTLTQQLAGMLVLDTIPRGWRRKIPEAFITLHLEQKLSKQTIFEDYANDVYLGNQGSFSINGFGEGAQVYFGKDLSQITLPEAALMAGLIQSQRLWDPFRHPDAAKTRRNIVLKNMRENGFITEPDYEAAAASPVNVNKGMVESSDAPYFVDLINNSLQSRFQDQDFHNRSLRVYTTLDMNLQRDAVEAIRTGIQETDKAWRRRSKKYGTDQFPLAQVCLIALDAQTGQVVAFVGGRSYGTSQLDHCLAKRQPGSSFKPIVYTAAMQTALDGASGTLLTPATTVVDEPTTFYFDTQPPYEPADFENKYSGSVTLRQALAHSMNVPAVKVAEMVGYDRVAQTARAMGLNLNIKPTPSIALGAYEVMPIEIAGAYTVFPNGGQLVPPSFIRSIRDQRGSSIFEMQVQRKQAIDPRVAYLVENMMEEVLRTGTGAGVHGRGFNLPAAGKTGTSFDGWFAGFTSKIICVVWMGFDDNRDFKLEGAHSALPIWVEFMKRAHQHREYRGVHPFQAPDGIVTADIDADTGELATTSCPHIRSEVFIAGTQPVQTCRLHGNGRTQIAGWEPVQAAPVPVPVLSADGKPPEVATARPPESRPPRSISIAPPNQEQPVTKEKKSRWGWIRGIFR